jgi:hypothetical protein
VYFCLLYCSPLSSSDFGTSYTERAEPSTHYLYLLLPIGGKIDPQSQMDLRSRRSRHRYTCPVPAHHVNGTLLPISRYGGPYIYRRWFTRADAIAVTRAMITRGYRRSMTSNSCAIFAFLMESTFLARAPTSERTPSHANPMTTRAFTPVPDRRSPGARDHRPQIL